ncbi:MAG TPA: hypothetical protein VJ872_17990 [Nocardioides sp.]|nr:hypothetical protein [Nocardioides sp.]
MSEEQDAGEERGSAAAPEAPPARSRSRALTAAQVRGRVATVVWTICVVIALCLAGAAFSYALDANPANSLIKLLRNVADHCDLGWFDLRNPIWRGTGANAETKTVLANYGIAAVVYLVVGRALERLIRR